MHAVGELIQSISRREPIAHHLFSSFNKKPVMKISRVSRGANRVESLFIISLPRIGWLRFSTTHYPAEIPATSQDQPRGRLPGSSTEPDRVDVQHSGGARAVAVQSLDRAQEARFARSRRMSRSTALSSLQNSTLRLPAASPREQGPNLPGAEQGSAS